MLMSVMTTNCGDRSGWITSRYMPRGFHFLVGRFYFIPTESRASSRIAAINAALPLSMFLPNRMVLVKETSSKLQLCPTTIPSFWRGTHEEIGAG